MSEVDDFLAALAPVPQSAFTHVVGVAELLANDGDPDGDTLMVAEVGDAEHGVVELAGDEVRFQPADDFHGAASYRYTVADGRGATASALVRLTVRPVNDRPVAVSVT